jgi:hypothetical protein
VLSTKIRALLQQQWAGLIALFLVLTGGTALAVDGPLPGTNQVGSEDIINGEVKNNDLGSNSVATGKIADAGVGSADLADNLILDDTADPLTGSTKVAQGAIKESELGNSSVFGGEVAPDALTGADIEDESIGSAELSAGSVGASEVANDSLTAGDINESTLAALDGHDAFDPFCDPSTDSYIDCASLTFTVGGRMPVLLMFAYSFGSGTFDEPHGGCQTTLDGTNTSDVLLSSDDDLSSYGGIPVVDVVSLDAGSHTIGLRCAEFQPDDSDIEIEEIRIAAVELAID